MEADVARCASQLSTVSAAPSSSAIMPSVSDQPNIVFIMADDHASKAISAYGAGINSTPNLDRIAKEGMLFNHW